MNPARLDVVEAAQVLRMSRAQLYKRIRDGEIRAQRDGKRRYISVGAIAEYVARLDAAEGGGAR
ncbi:MAG: helix-turn-helix domain-containing protein [Gammaproteobacteria bacterium]|nr:helix-turn-helix domain-containing protein [Gammaproteobacteria bacterium]